MTNFTNDNETVLPYAGSFPGDANGQAAVLLVESLIHSLIGRSVISVNDAIDIADTAAAAMAQIDGEVADPTRSAPTPMTILAAIAASLGHDRHEP